MFSFISSLIGDYFSKMEVITETLVIGSCLVFCGVVIKRLLHRKPSWETLPDDIMGMIVPHLSVRDRIRLSIVCKPWSSVSTRPYISSAPQLPWLLLSQSSPNHLSYFELSEGKIGQLELPEPVQGGWFQGSSKGWMIMIMEKDLDSTMFLVNPISGAQHQLPPLSTTPSFHSFVETTTWKRYGASAFCYSVVLSTSDITSHQFMVAATFGETDILCLYKPGDRKWTILEVLDANECITDLLFSSGKLYALVISHNKNGVISAPRNLKFGDHAVELKLVYDKIPRNNDSFEEYDDYLVHLKGATDSHLVESTTNDEIFLVHQVQDRFAKWYDNNHEDDNHDGANEEDNMEGNEVGGEEVNEDNMEGNEVGGEEVNEDNMEGNEDGGEEVNDIGTKIITVDEDDHDLNSYLRTSDFNVYKLHAEKKKIAGVRHLGDQLLFLSSAGALSLPAIDINNLKGNCIYFATNNSLSLHPRTFTSREIGVFSFDGRKINRSFPSVHVSVRSRLSWFTPNL